MYHWFLYFHLTGRHVPEMVPKTKKVMGSLGTEFTTLDIFSLSV